MKSIKYLVMDVDGTLTDGKIYMGESGELCKAFDIKDGCGIHDILLPSGIEPVIITGRQSVILERRCAELGIVKLYQKTQDKTACLEKLLLEENATKSDVAYIGDDINDLTCMRAIKKAGGVIGCPADAVKDVCAIADFNCSKKGGDGAVREFIEWLLSSKIN